MSEFAFYSYNLTEASQKRIDVPYPTELDKAQERFGIIFAPKTTLDIVAKKSNEPIRFQNTVLVVNNDIIVWRIHNEISKDIVKPTGTFVNGIESYESVDEYSYPYSLVIIDNRPGKMYMAIQKSPSWKGKTKTVCDVIRDGLSRVLQDEFGLDITITDITIPSKIWDFCEARCKDGKDEIKSVIIGVKNPKKHAPKESSSNVVLPEVIEHAQRINQLTNALETILNLKYNRGYEEKMRDSLDDVAHIIDICTQQEYTLSIDFKEFGMYKCNDIVQANFQMNDYYLAELFSGQYTISGVSQIEQWLDEKYKEIDDIRNATKIPSGKQRHN